MLRLIFQPFDKDVGQFKGGLKGNGMPVCFRDPCYDSVPGLQQASKRAIIPTSVTHKNTSPSL
jgi:hypothetical protein